MAVGCRSTTAPAADAAMASCVAAGTIAVAGCDLDRLRASPLYRELPDSARGLMATYQNASRVLATYDGKAILVIARGHFHELPAGATPAGEGLALFGPPDAVRRALEQQRTGRSVVPGLMAFAASVAAANPIWIVAQGGVKLPLAGNAANLNRLLANLEFAGFTVQIDPAAVLRLTALGRTADDARQFEETLRAMLTLTSAAESRQPEVAALVAGIPVERSGRTANAAVTVPQPLIEKLLGQFAR